MELTPSINSVVLAFRRYSPLFLLLPLLLLLLLLLLPPPPPPDARKKLDEAVHCFKWAGLAGQLNAVKKLHRRVDICEEATNAKAILRVGTETDGSSSSSSSSSSTIM